MTKQEFLDRLVELLSCLPADQVAESRAFYAEAIDDRIEDGMSEEAAVADLGTPGQVAEAILDELPVVPRAIVKTRRRSNALLWTLAIVGSPLWIVLLLAFAAVAFTVYVCIWVLALCVWIVAAALVGMAPVLLVLAYDGAVIGHPAFVVASCGSAFALLGVGLLVGAGAWAVSKQVVRLSALWARKALSPFRKDRSEKDGEADAAASEAVEAVAPAASTSRRRGFLAVSGGFVALGAVLLALGWALAGFDSSVFTTTIDLRDDTVVLGGVTVDDPTDLPLVEQIHELGTIDVSAPAAPTTPAAPAAPTAPAAPAAPEAPANPAS